jgi:hypothetical protein
MVDKVSICLTCSSVRSMEVTNGPRSTGPAFVGTFMGEDGDGEETEGEKKGCGELHLAR